MIFYQEDKFETKSNKFMYLSILNGPRKAFEFAALKFIRVELVSLPIPSKNASEEARAFQRYIPFQLSAHDEFPKSIFTKG